MPESPPRVCPRCRRTVRGACPGCSAPWRGKDERGSRNPWRRELRVDHKRWERFRAWYLGEHPLCARCERELASVVNHLPGTDYDRDRFSEAWVEGLCSPCNATVTGQQGRDKQLGR